MKPANFIFTAIFVAVQIFAINPAMAFVPELSPKDLVEDDFSKAIADLESQGLTKDEAIIELSSEFEMDLFPKTDLPSEVIIQADYASGLLIFCGLVFCSFSIDAMTREIKKANELKEKEIEINKDRRG